MAKPLKFIRKNGRIIPIRASEGPSPSVRAPGGAVGRTLRGAAVGAGASLLAQKHFAKDKSEGDGKIKVNRALDLAGIGLSVASGAIAAATFSGGAKGFIAGHTLAHGIDIGGVAANVASVAGKGNGKARSEQAVKQEARNFVIGNAVYLGGILGSKANRAAAVQYTEKGVAAAKKILDFARKGLGVA